MRQSKIKELFSEGWSGAAGTEALKFDILCQEFFERYQYHIGYAVGG
jgi:hypothetical protein